MSNTLEFSYQHQRAERSCLSSTGGEHGQQGMRDRLWMSDFDMSQLHRPKLK